MARSMEDKESRWHWSCRRLRGPIRIPARILLSCDDTASRCGCTRNTCRRSYGDTRDKKVSGGLRPCRSWGPGLPGPCRPWGPPGSGDVHRRRRSAKKNRWWGDPCAIAWSYRVLVAMKVAQSEDLRTCFHLEQSLCRCSKALTTGVGSSVVGVVVVDCGRETAESILAPKNRREKLSFYFINKSQPEYH